MATFKNRILVREGKGLNPAKYFFTTFGVALNTTGHSPANAEKLGRAGFRLQGLLETIPGVSSVNVTKWEIHVHKVKAYKWDEVYPQVIKALKRELQNHNFELVEENWLSLAWKRGLLKVKSALR